MSVGNGASLNGRDVPVSTASNNGETETKKTSTQSVNFGDLETPVLYRPSRRSLSPLSSRTLPLFPPLGRNLRPIKLEGSIRKNKNHV